ncbi:MAG: DUF983 domain-containing protein [Bacteroidia bacterium]|nr:DUF983 domain-containing protein [Bacteroidia bacterium]HQV01263.1 DUF983 domain-containing protein [Bacteroidia bacterium]
MPTILSSFILCKCPQCRQGNMFKPRGPIPFWDFGIMHDRCAVCDLNFKPEPGFYFGASILSYGYGVFVMGLTWFIMWYLHLDETWLLLTTITLVLVLFSPYNFKMSRAGWLAFTVAYKPNLKKKI